MNLPPPDVIGDRAARRSAPAADTGVERTASARLIPLLLLIVPFGLAVYVAELQGGPVFGGSAALALALVFVLAARATMGRNLEERRAIRRLADVALTLIPGLLVVYLGFNAGGFHPGTTGFLAAVVALLLAVRAAVSDDPLGGMGGLVALAGGAFALYAGWTIASGSWSDAPARALIELNRALLYLLAFVAMASVPRTAARMRFMIWGLAAGVVVVCTAGLVSRVLPELFPTAPDVSNDRLGYPVTYWNALGVLASIGIVLCFHLASSEREPRAARVLGAAAVPPLAATLLFTFSRGAIIACALGLVVYVIVARPRALPLGALATVPAAALTVLTAYGADALATEDPTTPAAISQGHRVALVVVLGSVAAAVLRGALLPIDRPLGRLTLSPRLRLAVAASALVAAVSLSLALEVPRALSHQYELFVSNIKAQNVKVRPGEGDIRNRLTDVGNNGRIDYWKVARQAFADARLKGQGAGTFETYWAQHATIPSTVKDAHSLWFEVAGELGVMGFGLLAIALGPILGVFAWRARGPGRALYGALLAAMLVWVLHAGVDWDWEMPVVTLWLFAAGGAALARAKDTRPSREDGPHLLTRIAALALLLGLAVVPTVVWLSQSRLEEAVVAYQRGDCALATSKARSVISLTAGRPDPYEILGFCDVPAGRIRSSFRHIDEAMARDPHNWEFQYDLAIIRATVGLNPRPAMRAAHRLAPREPLLRELTGLLRTPDRPVRARRAKKVLRSLPFLR